jgi:hypothetical protein
VNVLGDVICVAVSTAKIFTIPSVLTESILTSNPSILIVSPAFPTI